MDILTSLHDQLYGTMGTALYYAIGLVVVVALLAQWRLYEKAGQPGHAALVPVWNVIVFLRIVGRPAKDAWKFLIPFYGQLYFMPLVWIEVCQSFGKRTMVDYVLVIVFNFLYILNLGLSHETRYLGPVHGQQKLAPAKRLTARPSMAA
ncbi:MAG: DUF5684 domain-containing protein [Flavobacteriales bacterium]|jgi:hypothetical protein|nr:DUF5684 domain-containing protein [Flavobacteriales bacterium]